jgi:hypothetical protein
MAVAGASWLVAPVGTHPQFTGADFTDTDLLYAKTAEDFVRGEVLPKLDEIEAKAEGVMPALFHEDPRYFRKGEGSGWSRVGYSVSRGFVTRSDSGKTQPNWSNVIGKFAGAGLSNLYYPPDDRGASLTLSRVAISLSYQMLGNLGIEFWPEIHRKVFGGNKKQTPQSANSR